MTFLIPEARFTADPGGKPARRPTETETLSPYTVPPHFNTNMAQTQELPKAILYS